MELREAIAQISQIHDHLAQTTVFRGYRSLTVGVAGGVGVAAAVVQAIYLPRPAEQFGAYLTLWSGAAACAIAIVGAGIWHRANAYASTFARQRTRFAVEQFVPCLAAGLLLTLVVARRADDAAWMLPGLWAIVFSLGVFASCRLLPRPVFFVGLYYLLGGAAALACGSPATALSPWPMGALFGGGHFLAAVILYFTLERANHGHAEV